MAGYSKTPLIKKLGIKESFRIKIINNPDHFMTLLGPLPDHLTFPNKPPYDYIQLFVNKTETLENLLPLLQEEIHPTGMIWVSWYKKSSKKGSEITEDIIRDTALSLKLVDVKVCAIDQDWSGLKLVIRKALR